MDQLLVLVLVLGFLFLFLGLGIWIFAAVGFVGFTSLYLIQGMDLLRIGSVMKGTMWKAATTWELAAVPLFLLMGELIFRSDLSARLFKGVSPWVDWLPGRLVHSNIWGSTLFGAICGSSTATTATVGKITTQAIRERGYKEDIGLGSLAAAGSLGLMIPPSISFIIFGIIAEQSVSRLFAAGVVPGLMMSVMFSVYVVLRCVADPTIAPASGRPLTMVERLRTLVELIPVLFLMAIVLGSIYAGLATPSEAAAMGLAGAFLLVAVTRQLSWPMLRESLTATVHVTSMIGAIIVFASFMASAIAYLHLPQSVSAVFAVWDLSPYQLIACLALFYILLGCVLDGLSIMVLTLPVTLPLVTAAGFDPIWYGVFMVLVVEIGLVTPPVGMNLYVLQGLTGYSMGRIAWAALPFCALMILAMLFLVLMPEIALWLPGLLYGR